MKNKKKLEMQMIAEGILPPIPSLKECVKKAECESRYLFHQRNKSERKMKAVKKKQYRPCYVIDRIMPNRKALFHCWENKEIPLAKFDMMASSEVIQETMDKIHKLKAFPPSVEVVMQKAIVGIVEFEDGTVAEVNPKDIKFVPQDFSEYDF